MNFFLYYIIIIVGDEMKKLYLILLIGICLFLGGCGSDYTVGDIEGYHYEETEEVTDYVKILTNKNKVILIELYPDIAPITVANFQKLVSEKFYDNLLFHRVIKDFMIQTGDPLANGTGGSDETIKGEFKANGVENNLKHEEGVVSMARADDQNPDTTEDFNSASSQFFICVNSNDNIGYLDGNYAAFGKVIAGYDNVLEISKVATDDNDKPTVRQIMQSVRFVKVTEK